MKTRGLTRSGKRFLKKLFPGEGCVLSPEKALVYGADASRLRAAPWAVVRPESEEQVVEFMAWAHKERVPVYPRARGTNVVGAAVPSMGGVVVSCLNMDKVLDVDAQGFTATVQPGVVTGHLQSMLADQGLFYPPDPASAGISTIGGNVSTNAGGLRALKYGVTRDYVLGLRAVIPGGEVLNMGGRNHKDVVGLDLTSLFVGSAGLLGLLTEITVKLLPLPQSSASLLAGFDSLEDALEGAKNIFSAGILPVAMELMDLETLRALALVTDVPWPASTRAALLVRVDGGPDTVGPEIRRVSDAVAKAGPGFSETGADPEAEEALWEIRRLINPASFKVAPGKMSNDIAVPRSQVAPCILKIRDLGRETGLKILCFGHLGDGNLHVNVMYDPADPEQAAKASKAKARVMETAIALGGTISGEHGTGLSKREWLPRVLAPAQRRIMAGIKAAFDPHGIMNPGKEVPADG